jgi:polysaccharide export outer membrane protein
MKRYSYILILLTLLLVGCVAPKNVAYFQNAEYIRGMTLQSESPFRLRPKDKINIVINSTDPMLVQQFNLTSSSSTMRPLGNNSAPITSIGNVSSGGTQILAYTVDEQGDIDFPVLGKVAVEGRTRQEVAAYLRNRLIERNLVKDPIVIVEYVNLAVVVLGEVNRPGRVDVMKDYFTILDAIAAAGDLTINGRREDIMVFRAVDGEDQTFVINLCDRQDVLTSPAFYLQQNDVVYVSPNNRRKREFRTAGNTFNQPSFYISLASLLVTIAAFVLR